MVNSMENRLLLSHLSQRPDNLLKCLQIVR